MYINLVSWFVDYEREARAKQDVQKLRMAQSYHRGRMLMNKVRFAESRDEYSKGIQQAKSLNELWWEVRFEYEICYLCRKERAYQEMLDRSVKLVTRMRHPDLQEHPYRALIHLLVAWSYNLVDACGYRQEIKAALDFIEDNLRLDRFTHRGIHFHRALVALGAEAYAEAYEHIQACQSVSGHNYISLTDCYYLLSIYAFAIGDLALSLEAEEQRMKYSNLANSIHVEARAIGDTAVRLAWLKRFGEAQIHYDRSVNYLRSISCDDLIPALTTSYLIACGKDAEALTSSEEALQVAEETGSPDVILEIYQTRGYLLNRLGKPVQDEMKKARKFLETFRTPDCHLEKIQAIENGRTFAYDWQIKHHETL